MAKIEVGSRHAEFKAEVIARILSRNTVPLEMDDENGRHNCFFCSEPITTRRYYVLRTELPDGRYKESDRVTETLYIHTSCHDRGLLDAIAPVPDEMVAR